MITINVVGKSERGVIQNFKSALKKACLVAKSVDVREGRENCGSGRLILACALAQHPDTRLGCGDYLGSPHIAHDRSMWRNYGAPSGTAYIIDVDIDGADDLQLV